MEDAFSGADVVYPKSWGRLDAFSDEAAAAAVDHVGWIADAEKIALASRMSLYMHCLPADRGREVTDEVIDGPHSVVSTRPRTGCTPARRLALTMGGYPRR